MYKNFTYTVTQEDSKKNLSIKELLSLRFDISSRMRVKIKKNKSIYLNNVQVPPWIVPKNGDILSIKLPEETSYFTPENIPVDIVYEDDHLLIINKQAGLVSHPTHGHPDGTIANAVAYLMQQREKYFKIRFVNRLDRDTSGLLILAKDSHSQHRLSKQMADNSVTKCYEAIVFGHINADEGTIDEPIRRGEGRDIRRYVRPDGAASVTHYKVLKRFLYGGKKFTHVHLTLETGRTHQIRVHMSYLGHPLVGDSLYGGSMYLDRRMMPLEDDSGLPPYMDYIPEPPRGLEDIWLIGRQALHAKSLSFKHPITGEPLHIRADLPDDMADLIKKIH